MAWLTDSWAFSCCFLAPMLTMFTIGVLAGFVRFMAWLEERAADRELAKDPVKRAAAVVKRAEVTEHVYCSKCGALIHLSPGALGAARDAEVLIRCSCGNGVSLKKVR